MNTPSQMRRDTVPRSKVRPGTPLPSALRVKPVQATVRGFVEEVRSDAPFGVRLATVDRGVIPVVFERSALALKVLEACRVARFGMEISGPMYPGSPPTLYAREFEVLCQPREMPAPAPASRSAADVAVEAWAAWKKAQQLLLQSLGVGWPLPDGIVDLRGRAWGVVDCRVHVVVDHPQRGPTRDVMSWRDEGLTVDGVTAFWESGFCALFTASLRDDARVRPVGGVR